VDSSISDSFRGCGFVVVGAAGGMGSVLCRELVAGGASVLLCGRTDSGLAELGRELSMPHLVLDASDFAQTATAFETAKQQFGRLDGAANLAGSIMLRAAHQCSQQDVAEVLRLNLMTAFSVVRAAAMTMRQPASDRGASVVLMSSTAARTGLANHEAISAAKAGVIGLTQSAAATYASAIRFNCIAPGLTRTPMAKPLLASEMAEKASVAMHPVGRVGEVADVLPALLWLLSPASGFVTGQTIGIDGGLSTVRPRVKV